jgi:GDP-L-fucose synthase
MNLSIDMPVELPADIKDQLGGKKALVTGGTGMIGREVVRILLANGCLVTSVSLDDLAIDPRANYVKGDLSDLKFCLDICAGIDYVFHVAGIKGSVVVTKERPASFFVPLLMMNTNMLEAARRNKVGKILYTSSIGAYSPAEVFIESNDDLNVPPMDMFPGWAKRMAEMQIDAYRIQYQMNNFAIVRPSNIYGPGDNFDEQNAMVIPSLISRVHRGDNPVIIWGDGSSERDFLHSSDAAIGIILACLRGTDGKPINLGCGYGITIKKLVETLQEVTPFESFFDISKPSGFPRRIMDMSYAASRVGFIPQISLKQGLGQVWKWFLKNQGEHLQKQNYFRN